MRVLFYIENLSKTFYLKRSFSRGSLRSSFWKRPLRGLLSVDDFPEFSYLREPSRRFAYSRSLLKNLFSMEDVSKLYQKTSSKFPIKKENSLRHHFHRRHLEVLLSMQDLLMIFSLWRFSKEDHEVTICLEVFQKVCFLSNHHRSSIYSGSMTDSLLLRNISNLKRQPCILHPPPLL